MRFPQSQPLVKDCQFGVSPVNYSDSDSVDAQFKDLVIHVHVTPHRACKSFKSDTLVSRINGLYMHDTMAT